MCVYRGAILCRGTRADDGAGRGTNHLGGRGLSIPRRSALVLRHRHRRSPRGRAESWTTGETHVYKLQVTLQDNIAAKGKSATQIFTWEARNT